jgi:DNA polymerase elongation subunit (family B)
MASLQVDYLGIEMIKNGYLLPWHYNQNAVGVSFEGGKNYHKPGRYRCVCGVDVCSMHPSNMIEYNMSPETYKSFEPCEPIEYDYRTPQ